MSSCPKDVTPARKVVRTAITKHQLSREEQRSLIEIKNNLTLDPIKQIWTTTYECEKEPEGLRDNRAQAVAIAERTEDRLIKSSELAKYNDQFIDFINRGLVVELSKEEEKAYAGPSHYISHHEVYKPGSTSTPMRLVTNSSLKFDGVSPNDFWKKGP